MAAASAGRGESGNAAGTWAGAAAACAAGAGGHGGGAGVGGAVEGAVASEGWAFNAEAVDNDFSVTGTVGGNSLRGCSSPRCSSPRRFSPRPAHRSPHALCGAPRLRPPWCAPSIFDEVNCLPPIPRLGATFVMSCSVRDAEPRGSRDEWPCAVALREALPAVSRRGLRRPAGRGAPKGSAFSAPGCGCSGARAIRAAGCTDCLPPSPAISSRRRGHSRRQ